MGLPRAIDVDASSIIVDTHTVPMFRSNRPRLVAETHSDMVNPEDEQTSEPAGMFLDAFVNRMNQMRAERGKIR